MLKQNNENLNKTQQSNIKIMDIIIFIKVTCFCVKKIKFYNYHLNSF